MAGDTSKVNWKNLINNQFKCYKFLKEVFEAWKGHEDLRSIIFPSDYRTDRGMTAKDIRDQNKNLNKIFRIIQNIYRKLVDDTIREKVLRKRRKELKEKFIRLGKAITVNVKTKIRVNVGSPAFPIMVEKEVEKVEESKEFNNEWNYLLRDKDIFLGDKEWNGRNGEYQRINLVSSMFNLAVGWETDEPKGDMGYSGFDPDPIKEECHNCHKEAPLDYETKWINWEENKVASTGIEVPYYCKENCLYDWLKKNKPSSEYRKCVKCSRVSRKKECEEGFVGWNSAGSGGFYCSSSCSGFAGTGTRTGTGSSSSRSSRPGGSSKKCHQCSADSPLDGKWVKYDATASIISTVEFCSEDCLFNNLVSEGKSPKRCADCGWVARKHDKSDVSPHIADESGKKEDRCHVCSEEWIKNKRIWFIKNFLETITGWEDKLIDSERTKFCEMINSTSFSEFKGILHKVEDLIFSRSGSTPSSTDSLAEKRILAIRIIKRELDKDPTFVIEELDSENQNWEEKIENAADENVIDQIKERVLNDIKNKRNKKNLEQIRSEIINEINKHLSEEPKIETSELSGNSNWENLINQATEVEIINRIRDRVLANINSIKEEKDGENDLSQLISEAREAIKVGDWTKLDELLEKIGIYQNTTAYLAREKEIKILGKNLIESSADGFSKYQDNIINSLDEIINQDPPVDASELSESNRNYIETIKNAKNQDEVDQTKNALFDNINQVRTGKKVESLLIQAQEIDKNDSEEISRIRQGILRLKDSENKWEKEAWEKNKIKFEKLQWLWSEKSNLQEKTNLQDDKDPNNVLLISLISVSLVVLVFAVLLIFRQSQKSKQRKIQSKR